MATTPQRAPVRSAPRLRPAALQVSVVVINYCQWRNTDRVTRQLLDADAIGNGVADLIVVDNDSPPDPTEARLRRTQGVSLKQFDRNTGFARAANEGCRLAGGEWVLLLNPDTAVAEGFLDQLEALCRTLNVDEPRAGVIGLSLRHADGSDQPSCGPPPSLTRTLMGMFLPRRIRKCRAVHGTDRVAVPWVTGCGMLVRRACWEELGGFDESFFLYYEDADFCRRAWEAGWSVWYEPGLRLTHYTPLHTRSVPPELRLMTRHALLTYAAKYWGRWRFKALAGVVWLEAMLRRAKAYLGRRPCVMHAELGRLARDWFAGRSLSARWRIRRAARLLVSCPGREDRDMPEPIPAS
jgi:N-acetylglucosaminyl-diphospho-decaprenol L-rhamnosyltransferase